MGSKSFIPLIFGLCFILSVADPCVGETPERVLKVKKIDFERFSSSVEKVALLCNQACTPELFTVEGENPRLVLDMKGELQIGTRTLPINTSGKLVKRIRGYFDKQTKVSRIVLDMEKTKYYMVRPVPDPFGNTYTLIINGDAASPLSQGKQITILRSDTEPGEQNRELKEAPFSQEKPGVVAAAKDLPSVDEGRLQLNAGDFAVAVNTFTDILGTYPHDSPGYRLRGNAYDNLGDRQKAIEDWTQAARLGDTTLQSYLDFLQVKWHGNPVP